jgi:hypothetical protein
MTTEGGSTAKITAYAIEKSSCVGLSGGVEGCEVTAATPKTLPWSVTVNTSTLTAKATGVTYSFDTGCSIKKIETSFPELTLTPENRRRSSSSISVRRGPAWSKADRPRSPRWRAAAA